ncbi:PKD domain-containing protein [Oleiagrimonas sp. MCCC 1A03011]|uniref:PKD domain-containing protein n=1 Tax=Oleiagrimonas sp. MCCC 1A03011 TaxID=1926883 RepID=UPI001F0C7C56|nr:PKD domain-containing protein [Oleiagrimonas sp. MCCC 1A03011]
MMQTQQWKRWAHLTLGALGSVVGGSIATLMLAVVPVRAVHAQTATACAAPWSATTAYNGGDVASENGVNYLANWWTQGDDPATNNGPGGSGQPWTSQGTCGSSGSGGGTGSGSCAATWSASTAYNGGDVASENGVNYVANWWTQGDDPATNNGPNGSGQPWTSQGSCSGSSGGGNNPPTANFSDAISGLSVSFTDASSDSDGSIASRAWNFGDGGTSTATNPSHTYAAGGTYTVTLTVTDNGGATDTKSASVTVSSGSGSGGGGTPAGFIFSPYKDITVNLNWNTNVMSTKVTGSLIPVVGSGSLISDYEPNLGAITLAFATGTCGSENWGGVPGADFASANVSALDSAGVDYIVSTGGQAGTFSCSDPSSMVQFIQRYYSPHMVGVDFDIEGGQTASQLNALVQQVAYAETQYPNLRFSFTLATLAASDGSYGGLNSLGDTVMQAIQSNGLQHYTINLMVMDYGAAGSNICVVVNGACDMGQSAIQAAKNLEHTYGVPASQIELTPMIGLNDNTSEVFTTGNVDTVANYAKSAGLAGVHFWSLDRDTPCASNSGYASPTCNSVSGTTSLEYTNRFLQDFGL